MNHKLYHAIYDPKDKANDYKKRFQQNDFIDYNKCYANKESVIKDLKILQFFRAKTPERTKLSKREKRLLKIYHIYQMREYHKKQERRKKYVL